MVPESEAVRWRAGARLFQRKYDGEFLVRNVKCGMRNVLLAGERVRAKSGGFLTASDRALLARAGAFFAVFDLLAMDGQDVSGEPIRLRWRELCALAGELENIEHPIVLAESGGGGEFVEAVLAAGGEGVVAKDWDQPWGAPMFAVKRLQTFFCVVTGFCGGTQSVQVARIEGGTSNIEHRTSNIQCAASRVALRGGKIDRVRVGSVLKVEGMGLTDKGMIREPRLCRDAPGSWLVKF